MAVVIIRFPPLMNFGDNASAGAMLGHLQALSLFAALEPMFT
jgi:hypothetical protein